MTTTYNDALGRYGDAAASRSLTYISEEREDTAVAVGALVDDVPQLDPKLEDKNIVTSHRLTMLGRVRYEELCPGVMRFIITGRARRRMITELTISVNETQKENDIEIYIIDGLTTLGAGLFMGVEKLLTPKHFTEWTFNGHIQVSILNSLAKSISIVLYINSLNCLFNCIN